MTMSYAVQPIKQNIEQFNLNRYTYLLHVRILQLLLKEI